MPKSPGRLRAINRPRRKATSRQTSSLQISTERLANSLGDYELANVGIRRALVLDPDLIARPIDVRSVYPDAATFETQRDDLLKYVGDNSDDTNAQFLLGFIYYASAQPDMAVSFFRSVTDTNPKDELAVRMRDQAVAVMSSAPAESKP